MKTTTTNNKMQQAVKCLPLLIFIALVCCLEEVTSASVKNKLVIKSLPRSPTISPLENEANMIEEDSPRENLKPSYAPCVLMDVREQVTSESLRSTNKAELDDRFFMEKWLIDNINDLHRELKQTELDFEHFADVNSAIVTNAENQLRQELAYQLPIQMAFLAPLKERINGLRRES